MKVWRKRGSLASKRNARNQAPSTNQSKKSEATNLKQKAPGGLGRAIEKEQ